MFPTFTGSSRRPRNVNLSGQKNPNPFAANSWAPTTGGASKTVAEAQAERKQRQHERERLGAAQHIQRTWRGHRARRSLRTTRRQTFDRLYQPTTPPPLDPSERVPRAFPLVLSLFEPSHHDDYGRLACFARDLESLDFQPLKAGQLDRARLGRLVHILVTALQRSHPASSPPVLVVLLVHIIQLYPRALLNSLGPYFRLLAKYCGVTDADKQAVDLLQRAIQAPLAPDNADGSYISRVYEEFATSFLPQPLRLFEENIAAFAGNVDLEVLSTTILRFATTNEYKRQPQDGALWLLAHFIALQKAQPQQGRRSIELEALHSQLSKLSTDIRGRLSSRSPKQSQGEGEASTNPQQRSPIPPYIADELRSLVGRQEISQLLSKFTTNYSAGHARQLKDASWLAGYILTLIRCFPDQGDEIRMRLYLADITCAGSKVPAVKFFFTAIATTSVFNRILGAPQQTLEFLQQRNRRRASSTQPKDGSQWDSEWRTVLLFLELYTFVLRLTDDDDFFAGLSTVQNLDVTSSRVRLCMLRINDLRNLSLFLKYLAFRLHYNSAELLRETRPEDSSSFMAATAAGSSGREKAPTQRVGTYNVIPGLDFSAFKALVTSAVRMLYERDSRRTFLPKDHWLMTSNFDMDGFLSAVVLEEQRQHELRERGTDSDEGEDDDDDDDSDEDEDPGHVYHPVLTWGGQRRSQYAMVEKLRAQQRKVLRERLRAAVGPKLEILQNMPYVIPFETRVQIFRQFVSLDKQRRRDGHIDPDQWRMHVINQHGDPWDGNGPGRGIIGRHHAKIRRGKVFQDAFEKFYELGEGLKEPIQITFVDKFDTVEAGIDGGGVTKEFLTSVTKEAFIEEDHLFVANRHNAHYPNPFAFDQTQKALRDASITEGGPDWENTLAELLEQYEFLGRIVGKCLYEGILIDIAFAGFFLLKWASSAKDAGYRANINDLREMDEDLYQGMMSLKNFQGDVISLDLDFTINDQESLPGEPVVTKTRSLIPGGDKTLVTNENRPLYISYVARHRLVVQPYRQTQAFLRGLGAIIDPSWLSMFNQSELQRLVGGDPADIDVDDLRRNTDYSGVYQIGDDGEEHTTVKLFWDVMRTLRDSERRDVLKFVTSTPRAPLLGFSQLNPRFTIRDGGGDQERLPSASTCVNLLKLPRYTDAATLRTKLLYAVTSNAGFDLS